LGKAGNAFLSRGDGFIITFYLQIDDDLHSFAPTFKDAIQVDDSKYKYPEGEEREGYGSSSHEVDKTIVFNALKCFPDKE
jgi:hypothetical protein